MKLEIGEWHRVELPLHRWSPNFEYTEKHRNILIQFDAIIVGFSDENKVDVRTEQGTWRIGRENIIS